MGSEWGKLKIDKLDAIGMLVRGNAMQVIKFDLFFDKVELVSDLRFSFCSYDSMKHAPSFENNSMDGIEPDCKDC